MKTRVVTAITVTILLASMLTMRFNSILTPSVDGKFSVDAHTLALWHFDEGEGQIVYDESPHHNDGTLGPTSSVEDRDPSWVSGFTGMAGDYALSFDDWYDYVLVPDNPEDSLDLLHGNQFTIEFWTYVRQVSRTDRGSGQHWNVFIRKMTRPEPRQGYNIYQSSGYPVVSGSFYNGTAPDSESPYVQCEPPPTHEWVHFMFTYDGQYLRIYFNGTLQNESEVGHHHVAGNDLPLSIGKSLFEDTPWNDAVDCIIDEVRISSIPREPARENLLVNGDFEDGFNGWNLTAPPGSYSYNVTSDGEDHPHALDYRRWNSGSVGSTCGAWQELDISVQYYRELYVELDVKVINNTLHNSGWWSDEHGGNGEWPALVRITYEDANGTEWTWEHGFFPDDDNEFYGRTNFEYVVRNQWHPYVSPNLVNVITTTTAPHNESIESPTPYRLMRIFVGGTGWDVGGLLDNVTLWGIPRDQPNPVHNIDTGLDYATIQEAIDADETLDSHTILVDAGIYYENVVVDKSLSLIGQDRSTTIIDGSLTGNVINIMTNNVNITGFTIQNSGFHPTIIYSGIHLGEGTSGNNISYNIITNNTYGISLFQSSGNWVSGNNVTANSEYGIMLFYLSTHNSISANNISNDWLSIYVFRSSNNSISGNSVTASNVHAIYVEGSSNNSISGNAVTASGDYGIFLRAGSSNNSISGNSMSNNSRGIKLDGSSNNFIYHNNFINNTIQADVAREYLNIWDDGCEGNYWSDHAGVDVYSGKYQNETGSDGIGDTPYIIDEDNQDNYPLMFRWWNYGDIDSNGKVNILDIARVGRAFGSYPGHERWDCRADITRDQQVNIEDISAIAWEFGKHYH